jgi:hypothetical protein
MTQAAPASPSQSRLKVPLPRGPFTFLRPTIGFTVVFAFLGFFCWLAIHNLLDLRQSGLLPFFASAAWLLLVALILWGCMHTAGPRQFFVDFLGHFSREKFLDLFTLRDGTPGFGFGFRLLGLTFYHFIADLNCLMEVHWSTGQGSYFCHKDINDWDVAIWLRHESLRGTRSWNMGHDPTEVYLLGFCWSRQRIEPFGLEVIEFFRQAGVEFDPPEDAKKFIVHRRE